MKYFVLQVLSQIFSLYFKFSCWTNFLAMKFTSQQTQSVNQIRKLNFSRKIFSEQVDCQQSCLMAAHFWRLNLFTSNGKVFAANLLVCKRTFLKRRFSLGRLLCDCKARGTKTTFLNLLKLLCLQFNCIQAPHSLSLSSCFRMCALPSQERFRFPFRAFAKALLSNFLDPLALIDLVN